MYVYFSDMNPSSFQLRLARVTGEKVSTVKHSCTAQSSLTNSNLRRQLFRRRGGGGGRKWEKGLLNTFTGVCFYSQETYYGLCMFFRSYIQG